MQVYSFPTLLGISGSILVIVALFGQEALLEVLSKKLGVSP